MDFKSSPIYCNQKEIKNPSSVISGFFSAKPVFAAPVYIEQFGFWSLLKVGVEKKTCLPNLISRIGL